MRKTLITLLAAAALVWAAGASAVEMIVTTEVPATHWKSKFIQEFADIVAKKTNGDVKVKFFPGGQLYNDRDAMAALGTGAVHMVWPISSRLEVLDARAGLIGLPFTLSDEMMLKPGFAADFSDLMSSLVIKSKVRVLAVLRATDAIIVFKDKKVAKLEDAKGLKVREPGSKVVKEALRALGMNAVSMPASEMTTAMAQGAIDGAATSPAGWRTILGDTAKYGIYVPGFLLSTYSVLLDDNWLKALPGKDKKAIVDAIADIASRQWKEGMADDVAEVKKMAAKGAVLVTVAPGEVKRWSAAEQSVIKQYAARHPETWKAFEALVHKYEK